MRRLIVVMLAALLTGVPFVAAQDEGTTVDVSGAPIDVLPLSLVTESAPQTLEITSTTARVNFIGTEALACYLIYGTDDDYGDVTNDPGMSQAAIVEHNPILQNLEPDTEYQYRMMGTSEDGTLYVGAVYTFRTLAADAGGTDNLLSPANGAEVVEVSSNFGGGPNDERWGILNALDDNPATVWASDGDGDDAYFTVALDGAYRINEIVFASRSMTDGSSIVESFTVQADGETVYGPFEVPNPDDPAVFEVDFVASTLRFNVASSTGGNVGAVDVSVRGEPAG